MRSLYYNLNVFMVIFHGISWFFMVILGFWINQELDQPAISHGAF